jgi:hypothetical protein
MLPQALEQMKKGKVTVPVIELPKEDPIPPTPDDPPAEQLSLF